MNRAKGIETEAWWESWTASAIAWLVLVPLSLLFVYERIERDNYGSMAAPERTQEEKLQLELQEVRTRLWQNEHLRNKLKFVATYDQSTEAYQLLKDVDVPGVVLHQEWFKRRSRVLKDGLMDVEAANAPAVSS